MLPIHGRERTTLSANNQHDERDGQDAMCALRDLVRVLARAAAREAAAASVHQQTAEPVDTSEKDHG